MQHSHSRHQKTTSNLLRISLKDILKFNEIWPLEGAMYITLWQNFRGHPKSVSFMQFSQKIDGFRQKDSQGFLEPIQLYKQNPLEKFFIFTIYQNYTLALMSQAHTFMNTISWIMHLYRVSLSCALGKPIDPCPQKKQYLENGRICDIVQINGLHDNTI